MDIEQLRVGFMAVFCYLVSCPQTGKALFIDPAGDEERLMQRVNEKGLDLETIVNTHGHPDHTCGNARVKAHSGARIMIHELDAPMLSSGHAQDMSRQWGFTPSPPADKTLKDGEEIPVGDVRLRVIHTPGHSPGGICLLSDGNLFTGDTLFVGGIGRTDLPGASMAQFMKAIKEKILTLPGETVVWPGHDYGARPSSTVEVEKMTNPWLQ